MRQILIRGLRRSFEISGAPADSPLEALRAEPESLAATPSPEPILIDPRGTLWRMRLPNGAHVDGSLRGLAADLDARLVRNACSLEAGALVFPGALLQTSDNTRVLIVAPRSTLLSLMVLNLLRRGWSYEGNSIVFARRDGFVAYPQALRVSPEALSSSSMHKEPHWSDGPQGFSHDGQWSIIDVQSFGSPWRLNIRPANFVVFLGEYEGSRLRELSPISSREAFNRALVRSVGAPTAASLAALMTNLAAAHCYQAQSSDADDAAAALVKLVDRTG